MTTKKTPTPFSGYAPNRIFSNEKKKKIASDMLERYTGTPASEFRKQIILTNFDHYLQEFVRVCGEKNTVSTWGSAMRACHSKKHDVSIINFSIGSPTAALIIELLSTVDPTAVLLLGMCGGLHRSLKIGDFILPIAAIRGEGVSQHFLPSEVPALPTFKLHKFISQIITEKDMVYRTGVVHTTDYRFWEFSEDFKQKLYSQRVLGIEMECAALFVAGFASKVPIGALLLVSDLPLRKDGIKTKKSGKAVLEKYTKQHIEIGIQAMSSIKTRGEHIRHYQW